jgi:hypothetical protein
LDDIVKELMLSDKISHELDLSLVENDLVSKLASEIRYACDRGDARCLALDLLGRKRASHWTTL